MATRDSQDRIETAIKVALQQFIFSPNDRQTWDSVVAAISVILQNFWAAGDFRGSASDAFSVRCGLGSTMTANDILDGLMIVSVIMHWADTDQSAEVTFTQQMQKP
jgi:phage tail sheath protein FI